MKLRPPQDPLADCCWLPRLTDKIRARNEKTLPFLYRLSLGNPLGVDGFFLRHFKLSFRQFRAAVLQTGNDENLGQWFLSQPGVNAVTIATWNEFAPKLGTPGYPASFLKHVVKWFLYPKAVRHPVDSVFEMIEQDETT